MPLSHEQQQLILQEFIEIFQARYGEEWAMKLTTNLKPSPIPRIATKFNVPVSEVKKVRHKLMMMGLMFRALSQPLPDETPEFTF